MAAASSSAVPIRWPATTTRSRTPMTVPAITPVVPHPLRRTTTRPPRWMTDPVSSKVVRMPRQPTTIRVPTAMTDPACSPVAPTRMRTTTSPAPTSTTDPVWFPAVRMLPPTTTTVVPTTRTAPVSTSDVSIPMRTISMPVPIPTTVPVSSVAAPRWAHATTIRPPMTTMAAAHSPWTSSVRTMWIVPVLASTMQTGMACATRTRCPVVLMRRPAISTRLPRMTMAAVRAFPAPVARILPRTTMMRRRPLTMVPAS